MFSLHLTECIASAPEMPRLCLTECSASAKTNPPPSPELFQTESFLDNINGIQELPSEELDILEGLLAVDVHLDIGAVWLGS